MAKPIIFKKKCDDLCFLFYFGSSSNLKAKFFLAEQQNEVFFYDTLKIKPGLLISIIRCMAPETINEV